MFNKIARLVFPLWISPLAVHKGTALHIMGRKPFDRKSEILTLKEYIKE